MLRLLTPDQFRAKLAKVYRGHPRFEEHVRQRCARECMEAYTSAVQRCAASAELAVLAVRLRALEQALAVDGISEEVRWSMTRVQEAVEKARLSTGG